MKLVENRIDIVCIEQCSFFKNSNSDKEKFARIYALLMKLPQVKVVNHAKYEPLMIKVQMFAELEGTPRIGKDNQNDSENNDDIREER